MGKWSVRCGDNKPVTVRLQPPLALPVESKMMALRIFLGKSSTYQTIFHTMFNLMLDTS